MKRTMVCVILVIGSVTVAFGAPPIRPGNSLRPLLLRDELTSETRNKEKVREAEKRLDKLYALTNKVESLSADAQVVFRERITKAQRDYDVATNELAQIQAKLTPERRAELEASKRTREESRKLNAEVDAFENKTEIERKNREKEEREELSRKRAVAQEELAGCPKGVVPSDELVVYGTNIETVIAKCCPGADVEVNRWWTETKVLLAPLCEKALNVVLMDNVTDERFLRRWEIGCGKSLIECGLHGDSRWMKYDETGRLVKWAKRSEFPEYVWITNQHAVISAKLREEWAKKHGLTLEKAEAHAKELIEVINTPLPRPQNGFQGNASSASVGSLSARRNQRRAEEQARMEAFNRQMKEREAAFEKRQQEEAQLHNEKKAAREAEREEQRAQLLKIQEELKRAREEKKVQQL